MAIDVDNLDIILRIIGLRTFQAGMAEARASVASVGKQAMASDAAMAASSKKAMTRLEMLRKVSVGVGVALALTAAEAYKLSVNYEKEIVQIETHAGASHKEAMFMYKNILSLTSSGKFAQGPVELAKAMYHLESVGIRGRKALDALTQASNLAAVGNAHLEDTTSAVGAAWRAYRGEGISFKDMVATLNATTGAGNMRMNDLVAAMGTGVLPVFKTAGLTIKDFGGALALLTDEGQHADNAATHLRMAVNLLAAPSKLARKELRGIGLDALALSDQMKTPRGLINALEVLRMKLYGRFPGKPIPLQDVKKMMSGDPEGFARLTHAQSERMNVLSRAFGGARSGATIMAFIDQLESLRQKTDQVYGHSSPARFATAVAQTQATAAFKLKAAWSQTESALVTLGTVIRGPVTAALVLLLHGATAIVIALTWFVKFGGDVVHFWKSLPAPVRMVGDVLLYLIGIIALYKGAMIAARATTYAYIVAVNFLTTAIELARIAFIAFVVENPILLAIAVVIAIIILAVTHWHQFRKAGVDAWHWIKKAAVDAWHWIERAAHNIWKAIQNMVHKVTHLPGMHLFMKIMSFNPAVAAVKAVGHLIPGHAEGIQGSPGGLATINERATGETIWLPRGSSVQPSPAASLAVPRAHAPTPTPRYDGPPVIVENHNVWMVDRKVLFKAVTRATADDKARKGGK
jgi:TP901 family phage tail tape measure protein